MNIDLREHVLNRAAPWLSAATADRLELRDPGHAVTLAGPVRVRIRVNARNTTNAPGGTESTIDTPLFDYTLRVPSGHTWAYSLADLGAATHALGANAGISVVIEPVRGVVEPTVELGTSSDICCDAGTKSRADFGAFFPVGCEPCGTNIQPTLPPVEQPVDIPVAPGGCVRPRYFDGMYLMREDLEAEQRYHLIKNRMQNRAAGAGVVWGLDVGMKGTSVCVKPGFAWDCCGHDLVVTAPYLVDGAALVRDPAATPAFAKPGAQRMHLLLEYVECPDQPRPVHGDPCAVDIAACEMSRTRESVRLRLVPPRDFDGKGPIDQFLSAVRGIDWDQSRKPVTPQPAITLPFELGVMRDQMQPIKLVPSTTAQQTAERPDSPEIPSTFTVATTAGEAFLAGTQVVRVEPGKPDEVVASLDSNGALSWKARSNMFPNLTGELTYVIRWQMSSLSGETKLVVQFLAQPSARIMRVTLFPTKATKAPSACALECCAPASAAVPRFPTDPPWIHPHPDRPEDAADPAVLDLAWRYMSSYLHGNGPAPTEIAPEVQAALHDLCAAWAESLIYRGPTCDGAPHGVVIGCARVEGGVIVDVDPWGGRRWSMQYALLAHWATQLGILPPDLLLTKIGGLAGCVGDLPRLGTGNHLGPHPLSPHLPTDLFPLADRIRALAANAVVATPPLVRSAAEDIATSLAENVTLAHLVDGSPPWLSRLAGAGVSTIGNLLSASPEALHEDVLHREYAAELNTLITRAEETVTSIAKDVSESITGAAADRRITSRAELTGDARAKLEEGLLRRLKETHAGIDARAVHRAFDATTRGRG